MKHSALEGYGNKYWPICSSMLAWRPSVPDREAWQATAYRVAKSQTLPKWPCAHRCKTCFACGSSAPVRVECEGGATAWLAGTLAVPSMQGQTASGAGVMIFSESFFQPLVAGNRRPLWLVFLHSSACSGTLRAPLPGVLLCCSAHQAHGGASWLGSYPVDQHVRHLKGHLGWGSYSVDLHISHLKEHPGWSPAL